METGVKRASIEVSCVFVTVVVIVEESVAVLAVSVFVLLLTISLERRSIDACIVPCPRTAKTMTPCPADGSEGETGRLGHPKMPNWTTESTINARQIAYCPPRRKPLVPSIGSMTHMPVQLNFIGQRIAGVNHSVERLVPADNEWERHPRG